MNCIITEKVSYRGKEIPVSSLKPNSQIKVKVKCRHGERQVRWCRIHQWCHLCAGESGAHNTCPKGRKITWGDKISKAKKGKEFTEEHKKALSKAHLGVPLSKEHIEAQNRNRLKGDSHYMWKDKVCSIEKENMVDHINKDRHFYMLCGQSGAGKTTLAKHLHHKFTVVQYDSMNIKQLDEFIYNNWANDKPILIDIPMRISTNIKRYQDDYEIIPIFLIEDVETIKERINKRGGRTSNVERRYNRMMSLSKRYGKFTGNFEQVKEYLLNV